MIDVDRPDFNTLHGIALGFIRLYRGAGTPEEGISWMTYDWFRSLIKHGVAEPNVVHEVMLVLEDDDVIKRDHTPLGVRNFFNELDAVGR